MRSTGPQQQPIGVFDSGIGGLSVLREVCRALPGQDLVYVADTAHCPYGVKPPAFIRDRSLAIGRFLVQNLQAKALVVACNTATAHGVDALRAAFPTTPIVGMEPAVKPAAAVTRSGVVGVLATGATLQGERFARLVQRFTEGVQVLTQPCPGLVQQVEAGDLDGPETERLVRAYTERILSLGADTVVLGCTHYPFLRPVIQRVVGPAVSVLDSGAAVARQTRRVLDGSVGPSAAAGSPRALTSGDLAEFSRLLAQLWDGPPFTSVERLPI